MAIQRVTVRDAVAFLREDLGLSSGELASILAVPTTDVERLDRGDEPLDLPSLQRLDQLAELRDRLVDSFMPDGVRFWLRTGNRNLVGRSPLDLLREGEFDRVARALDSFEAGTFV